MQFALRYERGFLSRPNRRGEDADDEDQKVLALTFRDKVEWAVGHNTSVVAPVRDAEGNVHRLATTQLPEYEVRRVEHQRFDEDSDYQVLTRMAALAKLDGEGLERGLSPLIEAYSRWIDDQRTEPLPRQALEDTRHELMKKATAARDRMREGIELLKSDAEVREAFKLANQAMYVAALQADRNRSDKRYKDGNEPAWRPFQLAFVLLNLASIADPKHPDRKVADLIYFPTGGGKTEAYLGLIAFTLVLRRLRGKAQPHEGRGVAVILRYTLRLLTLDQLGRAATLMCALEEIRRRDPKKLGNARFTVGLWVGASATANRLKDVHRALHDYTPGQQNSPFPLTTCPWCGTNIRIQNIKLVDGAGKPSKTKYTRAVVYCAGERCLFTEAKRAGQGLPVLFVDEQIYQETPDFIVATVDKYAMVPVARRGRHALRPRDRTSTMRRAYGVMHKPPKGATPLPDGLPPPELVVQDELHLISGPLGTMVGLYEAAVDYLSERVVDGERYGPKVVCSTATVRRAREQIRALFGREMSLFPPRGINEGDNFFSKLKEDDWGRLYVGVGAPGRALRAVLGPRVRDAAGCGAEALRPQGGAGAAGRPLHDARRLLQQLARARRHAAPRRGRDSKPRPRLRQRQAPAQLRRAAPVGGRPQAQDAGRAHLARAHRAREGDQAPSRRAPGGRRIPSPSTSSSPRT